jgi:hypothetical protein
VKAPKAEKFQTEKTPKRRLFFRGRKRDQRRSQSKKEKLMVTKKLPARA